MQLEICFVLLLRGDLAASSVSGHHADFGVFGRALFTVPTFPIACHTPALRPDLHGLDGYTFPLCKTSYWNWPRRPTADWSYVGLSCSSERIVQRIYDAGIATVAGNHIYVAYKRTVKMMKSTCRTARLRHKVPTSTECIGKQ